MTNEGRNFILYDAVVTTAQLARANRRIGGWLLAAAVHEMWQTLAVRSEAVDYRKFASIR